MSKLVKVISLLPNSLLLLLASTSRVYAQDNTPLGGGECADTELNTAIGCIPITNANELIAFILKWAIGIGGGIAFLLIVVAGFQIITSSGDPKRLQAGKELMTSAIAGVIMLIFSVFILRIIGVDILGLGGFGLL